MKSLQLFFFRAALALIVAIATVPVMADQAFAEPVAREITATAAYELLEADGQAILVDVRDPIEVKFTGFATPTDIHVPLALADRDRFDEVSRTWAMAPNPDFKTEIRQALEEQGANSDTPIVFMCRSGSRSMKAAELVAGLGYDNVHSMRHGFEGSPLEEGESKGVRAVNGWRNSGLPWSYEIDPEVAWRPSP